ncbi:molybdopterin adenylyltransferase, partial [Piptocephalis cylindrospora]
VSDTVSQGLSVDQSSPALQHLLAKDTTKWSIAATACVPDDMDQIQGTLKLWSSHRKLDMVLTTGGTGFGQRDCTPEAVLPLLTKQAPGLVTAMLMSSIQSNPYAALSRPVCGSRGNTVIITLPGSPKGATENLLAIIAILPHAVELSRGATSRAVHEAM